MDVFAIVNVRTMQCRRFYAGIPINIFGNINALMVQRRRCCSFDSPGLSNDSAGYPGLAHGLCGTTPSVLRFLSVIRHEFPHYNHAFTEKAQHLQR